MMPSWRGGGAGVLLRKRLCEDDAAQDRWYGGVAGRRQVWIEAGRDWRRASVALRRAVVQGSDSLREGRHSRVDKRRWCPSCWACTFSRAGRSGRGCWEGGGETCGSALGEGDDGEGSCTGVGVAQWVRATVRSGGLFPAGAAGVAAAAAAAAAAASSSKDVRSMRPGRAGCCAGLGLAWLGWAGLGVRAGGCGDGAAINQSMAMQPTLTYREQRAR
ncbi:hypothetical protein BDZ91DRAFT_839452 [Kalaharituber pfeilii]|nr:hypothetical protein BDZ91DRAFT_839452 [Kalaharituber pfeilii]